MIRLLAKFFRGVHGVIGITAPPPGHNERFFVLMWLGSLAMGIGFCALLFYMMVHVF